MTTKLVKPTPASHVRITLRMQWDTTIASFESFMPIDHLHDFEPAELLEHYMPHLWGHTLAQLKEDSVKRMLSENHIE